MRTQPRARPVHREAAAQPEGQLSRPGADGCGRAKGAYTASLKPMAEEAATMAAGCLTSSPTSVAWGS